MFKGQVAIDDRRRVTADVVDHVVPVTLTTTDAQFYDAAALRASCRSCNYRRVLAVVQNAEPKRNPLIRKTVRIY
jgi:hypothetical protein